jgi:hypothetical protein
LETPVAERPDTNRDPAGARRPLIAARPRGVASRPSWSAFTHFVIRTAWTLCVVALCLLLYLWVVGFPES